VVCPSGRLRKDSLGIGVSIRTEQNASRGSRQDKRDNNNAKMRVVSINQQSQSGVFQGDPFPNDNETVSITEKGHASDNRL
jgi:hypothetical protein